MRKGNNIKKVLSLILAISMMISYCIPTVNVNAYSNEENVRNSNEVKINILGTTDLHGKFVNYEYSRDLEVDGGLNQIATIVETERKENPNTIVIDNGDTIQGNYNHLFIDGENPMIKGMSSIGYDVFSLGNHEFNFGMDKLNNIVGQANDNLSILCANLYKDNERVFDSYVIKEFSGIKVAIIGVVSPHIMKWDSNNLQGYEATNPVEEVNKVIDEIKANDEADIFVVSAHMGVDSEYGEGDSAIEIANANPEVSAIIAGHSHSKVDSTMVNNAIISQPKSNGEFISKIELTVEKTENGVNVINKEASLLATKGIEENEELTNELQEFHNKALIDARTVIGKMTGGNLASDDEVKGIPQSVVEDEGITDLVNEVQLYNSAKHLESNDINPNEVYHVSGAALFDANSNLNQGDITKAGVSRIYKYDNKLYTIKTTGKQLKKYLEWSASFYNTYKEGDLTISFNPEIRLYQYDMLDGVSYDINISKEAGQRIENIVFEKDNKIVQDNDIVYLAVNDYRYNSVLSAKVFDEGQHEKIYDTMNDTISDMRDLIIDYIKNEMNGVVERKVDQNWNIVGNDWDDEQRALAVKAVNEDKIKIPTSEDGRTPNVRSITWDEVKKALVSKVQLISFNDFHGNVIESGKNVGAAKLVGEINRLKEENKNTFVLSAGDSYQGTAISNLLYGEPVSQMLRQMGVTYSSIGNHEFDWGVDKISKWAEDGNVKFLASNIYDKNTGKPVEWAEPYGLIEVDGKKIGLIGLATPETAYKTKPDNVKELEFRDMTESASYWVEYLENEKNVDAVIVLGHIGSFQDSTTGEISGEAAELAENVTGIDAIISSHTHKYVSGKVNDVAIVQAGYNGRALGKVNLTFDYNGQLNVEPELDEIYKRVNELPVDATMNTIIDEYKVKLDPILNEVVVNIDTDLTHDRYEGLSKLGQFMTKYMAEVAEVEIAITNGGGLRKPLPAGDITVGDMWEVMPFDNTLVTMELKGSDIKKVLENGIMNESIGWVQFYGLRVYYDKDAEVGNRITSMRLLDGSKVEDDKYYSVVTNDFMASGGDNYDFTGAKELIDTGVPIRDAIIDILKPLGNVSFNFDEKTLVAGEDTTIDFTPLEPSKPIKPNGGSNTGKPTLPNTGAPINPNFFALIGVVSIIAGISIRKKKVV